MHLKDALVAVVAGSMAQQASAAVLMVEGSGTTNPGLLHRETMDALNAKYANLDLSYDAIGSSSGKREFVETSTNTAYHSDFGNSEIPLSADQFKAITDAGQVPLQMPFLIGGVAYFHTVPATNLGLDGSGDPNRLRLSADLLARIFSRNIISWDHADIAAEQTTNFNLPTQNIRVVHRSDGSSSTKFSTEYLDAASDLWEWGSGSTIAQWPTDTFGVQGSQNMLLNLHSNAWSIGYLDSGHAYDLNDDISPDDQKIYEVEIQNKDDHWLVSTEGDFPASADGVSLPASSADDWSAVTLVNKAGGPTGWPIVAFTYFMLRQDQTAANHDGKAGAVALSYTKYFMSASGQHLLPDYKFKVVPDAVLTKNLAGLDTVVLADGINAADYDVTNPDATFGETVSPASAVTWTAASLLASCVAVAVAM